MNPERARSVRAVIRAGAARLEATGFEHARHEAEWLLSHLLDTRPLELYLHDEGLPEQTVARFMSQIDARASGRPLQYLLGETEFCGERFTVGPGVFIPRPETETIVEAAAEALRSRGGRLGRAQRLLDLGTGSGCIAVTLARYLPACVVVGVELSWEALCVAKANVLRHGLSGRVLLVHGRWLDAIRGTVDGIVSNPPYICSAHVDHLPLDVRHEPRRSLDGGPDGLRGLLQLVERAPRHLAPGGILALECGEEQVHALTRMVQRAAWAASVEPLNDLAGRPRGVLAVRAE